MAEVQKTIHSGEMTQRFVEFVMMQQQQTLHALGRHPSAPPSGPPKNLTLAKLFIDQLAMIREKTRGNLTSEEEQLLARVLAELEALHREAIIGR